MSTLRRLKLKKKKKYDHKGYKIFLTICLWTDFDKQLYECKYYEDANFSEISYDFKGYFMLWRDFVIFFIFRPSEVITIFLIENFCHYFFLGSIFLKSIKIKTFWKF